MKPYNSSTRRLTIVQVAPDYYPVPPPAYGGIERVVHALTERLVRMGHHVVLFAPAGSVTSAELIPYEHGPGDPDAIRDFVLRSLPADADIVHDHTHASIIGRLRLPIPTVCTLHAAVNNGVDLPVYISNSSLNTAGRGAGEFIYNGIDPNQFDYAERKDDYLLYMGVMSPHKGVHHAIGIAERTGLRLVLAGPVFGEAYFQSEIQPALERNPNIEFVGEVGGETKRRLLRDARCMLFPTCCEEAFGLVMIEAMISGTPVLALANGAVPEVLAGFPELVCRDVEQMEEKTRLGAFPAAADLRSYVMGRFTDEIMARQYDKLFLRLAELHDPPASGIEKWKENGRRDMALQLCDSILGREASSIDEKLHACNAAAELCREAGDRSQEKAYVFRSFEFAVPRAEFCCRLGYLLLEEQEYAKAAYWYRLATRIEPPPSKEGFYFESCWTWLPHIQLCICHYHLNDIEQSYRHNEIARSLIPDNPYVLYNQSFLKPLIAASAGEVPESRGHIAELEGPENNVFRLRLHLPGFIEETIRDRGAWEPGLIRLLRRHMRAGGVFADIGANIGYHALYMASLGSDFQCVAVEPHPDIFNQLEENARLNGFSNVTLLNCAIGHTSGPIGFYRQPMSAYNRGLSGTMAGAIAQAEDAACVEVASMTLDEALTGDQKRRTNVIKIDTQGSEYEVLQGAEETIRLSRPIIAFEYHAYGSRPLEDIIGLLAGYTIYKLQAWTGELRGMDEQDPEGFEQDYVCFPDGTAP
ncbi:FkbM family methyltransferase [Paenibacillus soyae]|uniref:FkbM family methyltransferase n=1 Tax=Paenibacillus soyae TaxID=2969249 RepID=A0A9X2SC60_9BACL|nr:FkbM family methyltransferase [Paenibacillus soyae]MCR2806393.1 FkbM family methyltransferase [Paenibacillus soyae]